MGMISVLVNIYPSSALGKKNMNGPLERCDNFLGRTLPVLFPDILI